MPPGTGSTVSPTRSSRGHCDSVGRPFNEIVLTAGLPVNMPADPSTFRPTYEHSFYPGQTFSVLGPTSVEVIEEIERLVDHGVSHFQVSVEACRRSTASSMRSSLRSGLKGRPSSSKGSWSKESRPGCSRVQRCLLTSPSISV
jgi:hypothetical protein